MVEGFEVIVACGVVVAGQFEFQFTIAHAVAFAAVIELIAPPSDTRLLSAVLIATETTSDVPSQKSTVYWTVASLSAVVVKVFPEILTSAIAHDTIGGNTPPPPPCEPSDTTTVVL